MKYLNDVNYKDCVGKVFKSKSSGDFKVFKSKSSGDFKVLKYNGSTDVEIQFLKTGFEKSVQLVQVKSGNVKDPYSPSVYGVGILGTKYSPSVNGRTTKEYMLWCHMLERCYSDTYQKKKPTYEGCEVSDKFKSYEYFYEWCHKQVGFDNQGWHLDKDSLVKGNKVYSESTCVFLPVEINSLLTKSTASRGKHLIGVSWNKTRKAFVATVSKRKGKREHLGYFKTEIEAFNAYKTAKELYIKEVANKFKSQIDLRAYNALMSYEVMIDD